MKVVIYVVGAVLIAVATYYFLTPADQLPPWMPGFEAGMARVRLKHGIAAAVLGAIVFAVGYFTGRRDA
jgi:hypothetical protein